MSTRPTNTVSAVNPRRLDVVLSAKHPGASAAAPVAANALGGYVANLFKPEEVRTWSNIDLFDTLNETAIRNLAIVPPRYMPKNEMERNHVLVTAILTLNAQNQLLQARLSKLEK